MKGVSWGIVPAAALFLAVFLTTVFTLPADEPVISGNVSSSADADLDFADPGAFLYAFEQYANLRLLADTGESGRIHAAVNLIAASGSQAADGNYAAALELERLYLSIAGEYTDTDLGLMRIAFGYGQAFRPTDFLNPPNPLLPDARPQGVLGAALAAYPSFTVKLQGFAVSGTDPLEDGGKGMRFGTAAEAHFSRTSLQGLYCFQAPDGAAAFGLHRAGLSLKLEAGAAFVLDALYTLDPDKAADLDGLEAALGADYSIIDGKLYLLAQYLYDGPGLLDPLQAEVSPGSGGAKQYLYSAARYSFSDISRWGVSCLLSMDDASVSPALSMEHDAFQGMTTGLTARLFLDKGSISNPAGTLSARVKMIF
jgi:hypothetical protein